MLTDHAEPLQEEQNKNTKKRKTDACYQFSVCVLLYFLFAYAYPWAIACFTCSAISSYDLFASATMTGRYSTVTLLGRGKLL